MPDDHHGQRLARRRSPAPRPTCGPTNSLRRSCTDGSSAFSAASTWSPAAVTDPFCARQPDQHVARGAEVLDLGVGETQLLDRGARPSRGRPRCVERDLHHRAAGEFHRQVQPAGDQEERWPPANVRNEMTLKTSALRMNGMSRRILKNSMCQSPDSALVIAPRRPAPDLADDTSLAIFLRRPYQRSTRPREKNTAENIEVRMPMQWTTAKPLHRPRAEREQRDAGDQRGDVRVEDRRPGALVAGVERCLRRGAVAQFLAHPLVDQHIGVDRHAQRQRDRGHARQGQRSCSSDSTATSSSRLTASARLEIRPNSM